MSLFQSLKRILTQCCMVVFFIKSLEKVFLSLIYILGEIMGNNFLKWWLLNATVILLLCVGSYFGLAKEVYLKDSSFLCFVIVGLYFCVSGVTGWLSIEMDKDEKYKANTDLGWFVSDLLLSLGMIGTVIGFIQMLAGFVEPVEGAQALKVVLGKMAYGMSTALYTTLAGLIFGNLLKLQCFYLDSHSKENACQDTKTTDPK